MQEEYFKHPLESLPPAGDYEFITSNAEFKVSKKDQPMIVVTLNIIYNNEKYFVNDYLVLPYKFKQFWLGVGHPEFYEREKNLVSEYNEKTGTCVIKHGEYNGQKKLEVDFYHAKEAEAAKENGFTDDDITF